MPPTSSIQFLPNRTRSATRDFGLWGSFLLLLVVTRAHGGPPAPEPALSQDAYVWQRVWGSALKEALQEHGSAFTNLLVLKAEVSFKGAHPSLLTVPIDYPWLAETKRPIGLVIRIGPYPGPFTTNSPATRYLADLAQTVLSEPRSNHINPAELQLDFDCAESKLDGYRVCAEAIRRRISPVSLTITALPSWLNQAAFERLVQATDGYVLQVHSLEKPSEFNAPFTLCDPAAARRAVERAGKLNVPFRVALPTYGYHIAFDNSGRFVGLSAEGPPRNWSADVRVREVRSDPLAIAELMQFWSTNRPPMMGGIIWYRFPTSDDILNWRWPTLGAMVALRSPHLSVKAESRRVEAGLVEISLVNNGELDLSSRLAVEVRWSRGDGARLIAADGLHGFEAVDSESTLRLQNSSRSYRLPAGESQVIGWLRFNSAREVQVELKTF